MKSLAFLLLLISFVGCDPYGFGFKKNPAYVLDEALKAISNQDTESFLEVTGKEVLCIYGNHSGMNFLKDNIQVNPENIKLKPVVLENVHYTVPTYVGYWSYYHERYKIDIQDKVTSEVLFTTIIDCDYGVDDVKNDKYRNLKPQKYKKKECKLMKMIPHRFNSLPVSTKCENLKVNL